MKLPCQYLVPQILHWRMPKNFISYWRKTNRCFCIAHPETVSAPSSLFAHTRFKANQKMSLWRWGKLPASALWKRK